MNNFTIIFLVIFVFSLNIYLSPVYAAHILDRSEYFDDHPFRLTIVNPTSPSSVVVTADSPATGTCSYTLTQIIGTSTWQSSYIYFTTGSTCTSTTLPMGAVLTGSFTVTSDDTTPTSETATVTTSNELTWPVAPMQYQPQWSKKISNCSPYGNDTPDDDGICNGWEYQPGEDPGGFVGLRVPYVDTGAPAGYWELPCGPTTNDPVCPSESVKDIYVEIDWMEGHRPSQQAIDNVKAAFANATPDTELHVLYAIGYGDEILHDDSITTAISGGTGSSEFDSIKKAYFGNSDERLAGNEGA
ncbi:MAG: hypothetical protein ACT4N5_08510 [Nitrosopumilaceae archaeon]